MKESDQSHPAGPQWTADAIRRASERFPDIDMDALYREARLVPAHGKTRKRIKACCPTNARKWMENGYAGRYYKIALGHIVFVLAAPETIITVFRLPD